MNVFSLFKGKRHKTKFYTKCSYRWTGHIPCTGSYRCVWCGHIEHNAHSLDYSKVNYNKKCPAWRK